MEAEITNHNAILGLSGAHLCWWPGSHAPPADVRLVASACAPLTRLCPAKTLCFCK